MALTWAPKWGQKWGQNGSKMGPRWGQDGAKMGPKWVQDGAKMGPKWGQNGAKMGPKWGQNGSTMGPKWVQNGSEMGPKWVHNGSKMGLRLVQIGPKQATCFFPFFVRSSAPTGPAGSAYCAVAATPQARSNWHGAVAALPRVPYRGRLGVLTALLRPRCGSVQTSSAVAACHGRVNTSPQLPSHLWGRPTVARPFVGQAHSCPASCRAL